MKIIILWIASLILVAVSMLVDVDVPVVPEPRYHVESVQDGLTLYLAFVNYGRGMDVDIRPRWVVSESQAWPYSGRVTAQADADRYGGTPVPMRMEK